MTEFDNLDRAVRENYEDDPSALRAWERGGNDGVGRAYAQAYYDIWTGNAALSWGPAARSRAMGDFWDEMARFGIEKFDGTFDWKAWKQEYESNGL